MAIQSTAHQKDIDATMTRLERAGQALAAQLQPPFTPARMAVLKSALAACDDDCRTLERLLATARRETAPHDFVAVAKLNEGNRAIGLWQEARGLVKGLRRVRQTASRDLERDAHLRAYERGFEFLHAHFCGQAAKLVPDDWPEAFHRDIALPFTRFQDYALLARRMVRALGVMGPLGFLDVGCGVGLKLLQGASFFERVAGLEYEPHRSAAAADWLGTRAEVITGDALAFDGYGRFDVLYAYKPVQDEEMMRETERRMIAQSRPGTVFIMPYQDFHKVHQDLGCIHIRDAVYVSGISRRDVSKALQILPYVGLALPAEMTRPEGFARPLRAALRHWGHLS